MPVVPGKRLLINQTLNEVELNLALKCLVGLETGSRVCSGVVRKPSKTSPNPRCAPCASHCQCSDGRRAKKGGKDGEGGETRHNYSALPKI